jgi:D-glycerate 3-kinase
VSQLESTLSSSPHDLPVAVLSIDDLYLPHDGQIALASAHPLNPLVQHRGEPGTHDIHLATSIFTALRDSKSTALPSYDKSLFNGQGDRVGKEEWRRINVSGAGGSEIKVIIFEGWCVGFRALKTEAEVASKQAQSIALYTVEAGQGGNPRTTLWKQRLEDLSFINDRLRSYDVMTDMLDAMIHIDAEDTSYVYKWRLQQEAAMREQKGRGMSDEEVVNFVDGYYPAYELYTDGLRNGIFSKDKIGCQLRLIVGEDREVMRVLKI